MADSDPLVASSVFRTPAQNWQREGRSVPRQGRDHIFQWGMVIGVGFFTETTSFLRNPGSDVVRHTYMRHKHNNSVKVLLSILSNSETVF